MDADLAFDLTFLILFSVCGKDRVECGWPGPESESYRDMHFLMLLACLVCIFSGCLLRPTHERNSSTIFFG